MNTPRDYTYHSINHVKVRCILDVLMNNTQFHRAFMSFKKTHYIKLKYIPNCP